MTDRTAKIHALVAETLARLGHDTLFGLLGSGNFKLTDHLVRQHGGRFVWVRHEAAGVVAADAWARVTRRVGLATVHQGPGLTNTMTTLVEAAKARTPLLVLAGDTGRAARLVNQDIDQREVARAAGAAVEHLYSGASAVEDVARAAARAERERIPVVLSLPIDLQEEEGRRREPPPAPASASALRSRPAAADVAAVADLVERARRPAISAGRGAVLADARRPLEALAERIGALLATSLIANGLFAGSPWSVGVAGGFSTKLAERLLPQADLVLAFGASLNQWTTMHGRMLGDADIVQCDTDPSAIGRQRPVRLGWVGDAAEAAAALCTELERRGLRATGWRKAGVAEELRTYRAADDYAPVESDGRVDPRTLTVALDRALPEERTVVMDGGHFHWFPTPFLRVPDPEGFVFTQAFQAIGLGLATAVGAAVARPDRPVLALVGDGGAMMSLGELDTITAQGLDVLVAVYNDAAYGAELHHFGPMGLPTDLVEFGDRDFAALGAALGARSATISSAEDVEESVRAWRRTGGGPLVLDCKVDPRVRAERLDEAFRGGA
jgi:thiamine pyrophosphate-dependent acetolactate synthase large subunit-like protein